MLPWLFLVGISCSAAVEWRRHDKIPPQILHMHRNLEITHKGLLPHNNRAHDADLLAFLSRNVFAS